MEHENMTTTETAKLIEWLLANGHTTDEACACIKYIAGRTEATSTK